MIYKTLKPSDDYVLQSNYYWMCDRVNNPTVILGIKALIQHNEELKDVIKRQELAIDALRERTDKLINLLKPQKHW